MRWIVLTVAAALLCLAAMVFLQRQLNQQESAQRAAVVDYAGAAAKRLSEPDTAFPTTPPRDFTSEVAQTAVSLGEDERTRAAAMEVLTNLPGAAYPAIRAAAENSKTPKAAAPALSSLLNLFSHRAMREEKLHNERVRMFGELLSAFQHFGRHDPKWNLRAPAALTAFFQSDPTPFRTAAQETWIVNAIEKVITDAGCDDPVILFAYGCMIDEMQTRRLNRGNDSSGVFLQAATIAAQDNWPARWQALFNARALATQMQLAFKTPDQQNTRLEIDAARGFFAIDWLPSHVKLDWARRILENQFNSGKVVAAMGTFGGAPPKVDPLVDFKQLDAEAEKQFPGGIEPLILTGDFYIDYAWNARGSDRAYTVTEQGWKLLRERLLIAQDALQKAFEKNPSDPLVAADMIVVCMGLNQDPATARQWLDRALAADPDNREAVQNMLEALEPKWHGNSDDPLKFARACRATQNFRGGLALAVAQAHERLAMYEPAPGKYLSKPDVWDELRSSYESYLALFPNNRAQRTHYAYDAARAEKWAEARAQFAMLGDDPWPGIFPNESYDSLRMQADKSSVNPDQPH